MNQYFAIRDLQPHESAALGRMMVEVYSLLEGFPSPGQQPGYYRMLANIGDFPRRKDARVLVACSDTGMLMGGIVYFGDMAEYGSGGTATGIRGASGIRLLGVSPEARGKGVGKALARACIDAARAAGHREVILHTTHAMKVAWALYERLGFVRSEDLDFHQGELPVFGFRLQLDGHGDEARSSTRL